MRECTRDVTAIAALWLVGFLLAAAPAAGAERFVRGDADASGQLKIADAVNLLRFLFQEQAEAVRCQDAADTDDSGMLEVTDAIHILNYLFQHGVQPLAPFPFCGEDPSEDELLCETYEACIPVHDVFGIQIPADGVFFVIDRSGSFLDSGELALAKGEAEEVILAFPDGVQFGVLFADSNLMRFPQSGFPLRAEAETRRLAVEFVRGIAGGFGSCDRPALLSALDFARLSTVRADVILYVTDGGGTCQGQDESQYLRQTIEAVTAANQGLARIYCLQIGPTSTVRRNFLRDLAAQNGGEHHEVPLQ